MLKCATILWIIKPAPKRTFRNFKVPFPFARKKTNHFWFACVCKCLNNFEKSAILSRFAFLFSSLSCSVRTICDFVRIDGERKLFPVFWNFHNLVLRRSFPLLAIFIDKASNNSLILGWLHDGAFMQMSRSI